MPAQTKNKKGKLRRRAMRDVKFASEPYLDELAKQRDQAKDTYQEGKQQVGSIYDAFGAQMQDLLPQYQDIAKQIGTDLNSNVASLSSMMGQGTEAGAATGYLGTIGATGQSLLASDRARNLGYQTSVQRQGAMEEANVLRNMREEYDDIIQTIRQARLDEKGDWRQSYLTRLDQLRDSRKQNRLAQSELELRQKIAEDQLNFQKKQHRDDEHDEDRATDFFINAAEQKLIKKGTKPLRKALADARADVKEYRATESPYGPSASPTYEEDLAELKANKRQIRKRLRKKRRVLRNKYGEK